MKQNGVHMLKENLWLMQFKRGPPLLLWRPPQSGSLRDIVLPFIFAWSYVLGGFWIGWFWGRQYFLERRYYNDNEATRLHIQHNIKDTLCCNSPAIFLSRQCLSDWINDNINLNVFRYFSLVSDKHIVQNVKGYNAGLND